MPWCHTSHSELLQHHEGNSGQLTQFRQQLKFQGIVLTISKADSSKVNSSDGVVSARYSHLSNHRPGVWPQVIFKDLQKDSGLIYTCQCVRWYLVSNGVGRLDNSTDNKSLVFVESCSFQEGQRSPPSRLRGLPVIVKKTWFVCDFLEAQNRKGTESGLGLAGLSENWRKLFCLFMWDEDYRVMFYLLRYFSSESFNLKSLMILMVLAL